MAERLGESNVGKPSFLEAVLSNAGQVEMSDIKERIMNVTQNVSQLKLRVHDYMKSKFIDFDPLMKRTVGFLDNAVRTSDEINTLFNRIEFQTKHDLANSTGELRSLHDSLKEASVVHAVTTELLQMESFMRGVEDARKERKFVEAAKSLQSLRELLKESSQEVRLLDIYKSLQRRYQSLHSEFYRELLNKLTVFISWESSDAANNVVKSIIKLGSDDQEEKQEVLQAFHLMEELDPWLNKLRKFLMRSVLIPLILNEATVNIHSGKAYSSVQVAVKTSSHKPPYLLVLDNLTKCLKFLHEKLDMQFENGDFLLGLLGCGISAEFTDNLIKKCLKETVPSTHAEPVNLTSIQDRVIAFNKFLVDIGFLSENDSSIVEYAHNIYAVSVEKAFENYLKKAREIMKKDLQDMVEVGPQTPLLSLSSTLDNSETVVDPSVFMQESFSNIAIKAESDLNSNFFQFPKCCVSKSTIEILDLVSTILEDSKNTGDSKENGLVQYFISTAKIVFELYMAVVPTFHENQLSLIPQQVALFHNNCMFLAHRLNVLGFEVDSSLHTNSNADVRATFVEYVVGLRHLGTVTFLKHMRQQRKQMLDLVKESGLATLGENSELSSDTERTLDQCLKRLELLQIVWQTVLPGDVYSKSIGVLANTFVEELILRVVSVEDIPANTAVHLTSLFKKVSDRIPKLFENGSKVVLYVKQWRQFQELISLLNASLREIEEGWADGKGPLAHEFSVEQVKQLIRALFQNTSRRAEVLAKIK
ncbi:centromere/kinetochore protein zw10 homolog [Thrips palmi]|uniref:Centromere/kinetochore protein zw10 homolog n=1 Tax=Thrips palmi TaxID=161013 RepID=A0A6P8ZQL3_THRPL|nr:centromere/kinetochore protein zw10 homolog [Thrips palmi]